MTKHDWSIKEINEVEKNGLKVFSCFSCGGGSTMGYKLAGFDVIGNVEIDPSMMKIYKANHRPLFPYEMPIQEFKLIDNGQLPKELFNLDVLDGSPPCSTFSTAGKREKKWGGEFIFKEGQAKQRLDDLFFDFIDVADKLLPKVVVAENVKGLITGKARGYVHDIIEAFHKIDYDVQIFKLNAATMGVPQKRERVFFIARRRDLNLPKVQLEFNEPPILYGDIRSGSGKKINRESETYKRWSRRRPSDMNIGDITHREVGRDLSFNTVILKNNRVANTLASGSIFLRDDVDEHISDMDVIRMQTFPYDYDFMDQNIQYVCGMSVPPIMMKKIAEQLQKQLF